MPAPPESPSSEEAPAVPARAGRPAAWAWMGLLLILYPLLLGLIGALQRGQQDEPFLTSDIGPLLASLALELAIFGVLFLVAWAGPRPGSAQLGMRRSALAPMIWRSILFSIGLRLSVMVVGFAMLLVSAVVQGGPGGLEDLRAHTEVLVDAEALAEDPVYLWLNLTLVSFVVAGLREELWRAGMFAALQGLFPNQTRGWGGKAVMVLAVAVVFGLGHLPQGLGGVLMTTVLGFGLGVILLWRRSLWEAVLAHGFFNAASFLLLYLLARFFPDQLPGSAETATALFSLIQP